MNTMQRAHAYARARREEYPSYKEALREGLKLAHAEARAAREEGPLNFQESLEESNPRKIGEVSIKHELYAAYDTPETRAAAIIREGVQKYRERVPLLCRDWKAEGYDGRRDYRAWS